MPRHHAQGQAGAQPQGAGQSRRNDNRRRRTRGGDRRQPQDGDLPARPGAGDGARARRAPAALQGKGPLGRDHVHGRCGPVLDRYGRPQLHAADEGAEGLARQPRGCGPHRAQGIPEEQQIPQPAEQRQGRRRVRGRSGRIARELLDVIRHARPCAGHPRLRALWEGRRGWPGQASAKSDSACLRRQGRA